MSKAKIKFVGIIDRRGIESFYPLEDAKAKGLVSFLALRAQANAWRGARTFCVELNSAEREKVEKLLQGHKWQEAARLIQERDSSVRRSTCQVNQTEHHTGESW